MIHDSRMPTRDDLLWPTLKALESTGGSASIQELMDGARLMPNWSKTSPARQ